MIRFDCPTCGREYLLADALAGLPLLCKGCGQRITPPAPQPDPEPEPPRPEPKKPEAKKPEPPPAPGPLPLAEEVAEEKVPTRDRGAVPPSPAKGEVVAAAVPLAEEVDEGEAETLTRPTPAADVARNGKGEKAEPPSRNGKGGKAKPILAPPAVPAPAATGGRRLVGVVVDLAVVLLLVAAGVWVGEQAVGKPTAEVLAKAGDEPFPPTDVLAWAGCPAVLVLIYAWLGTRGWTVGGWLRRRAG